VWIALGNNGHSLSGPYRTKTAILSKEEIQRHQICKHVRASDDDRTWIPV